jgi:hypothetical protein
MGAQLAKELLSSLMTQLLPRFTGMRVPSVTPSDAGTMSGGRSMKRNATVGTSHGTTSPSMLCTKTSKENESLSATTIARAEGC